VNNLLTTVLQIYRMIRHGGSKAASPGQSLAIPFRATGIAVCLRKQSTSETVQRIGGANL